MGILVCLISLLWFVEPVAVPPLGSHHLDFCVRRVEIPVADVLSESAVEQRGVLRWNGSEPLGNIMKSEAS